MMKIEVGNKENREVIVFEDRGAIIKIMQIITKGWNNQKTDTLSRNSKNNAASQHLDFSLIK